MGEIYIRCFDHKLHIFFSCGVAQQLWHPGKGRWLCGSVCLPSRSAMWCPDSAHSQQAKSTLTTYCPHIPIGFPLAPHEAYSYRVWFHPHHPDSQPLSPAMDSRVSDLGHAMTLGAGFHSTLTHWHFVHCHTPPRRAKKTKLRLFSHCLTNAQTDTQMLARIYTFSHMQMHTHTHTHIHSSTFCKILSWKNTVSAIAQWERKAKG